MMKPSQKVFDLPIATFDISAMMKLSQKVLKSATITSLIRPWQRQVREPLRFWHNEFEVSIWPWWIPVGKSSIRQWWHLRFSHDEAELEIHRLDHSDLFNSFMMKVSGRVSNLTTGHLRFGHYEVKSESLQLAATTSPIGPWRRWAGEPSIRLWAPL